MLHLQYYKVLDEDGNRTGEYKCSNAPDEITSCCTNCQNYVKSVVQGLSHISDQDFKMYTPYYNIVTLFDFYFSKLL